MYAQPQAVGLAITALFRIDKTGTARRRTELFCHIDMFIAQREHHEKWQADIVWVGLERYVFNIPHFFPFLISYLFFR